MIISDQYLGQEMIINTAIFKLQPTNHNIKILTNRDSHGTTCQSILRRTCASLMLAQISPSACSDIELCI